MVVGQVGRRGAAVPPVFAREIREFEQELAPIRSQVKTESTVTKETVRSKRTAWVSTVWVIQIIKSPSSSRCLIELALQSK